MPLLNKWYRIFELQLKNHRAISIKLNKSSHLHFKYLNVGEYLYSRTLVLAR